MSNASSCAYTRASCILQKAGILVPNLDRRRKILMDFYAWLPFFKVSPIMLKANVQAYSIQKDLEKDDCNLQEPSSNVSLYNFASSY